MFWWFWPIPAEFFRFFRIFGRFLECFQNRKRTPCDFWPSACMVASRVYPRLKIRPSPAAKHWSRSFSATLDLFEGTFSKQVLMSQFKALFTAFFSNSQLSFLWVLNNVATSSGTAALFSSFNNSTLRNSESLKNLLLLEEKYCISICGGCLFSGYKMGVIFC